MTDPQPAIDLNNYIPKADYEKAINEKDSTVASLRDQISKVQAELLSPEYIDFKTKGKQPQHQQPNQPASVKDERVDVLAQKLQVLELQLEWRDTSSKYPDLEQYKDKINKFYQETGNAQATYEQAYKLVKLADEEGKTPPKKEAEAPKKVFATEKPGGSVPFDSVEKKDPKNIEEANAATIASMRDKYPGLGDTL